jgi:hypothetical protein
MADITMCSGDGCPWKLKCVRYTSKPSDDRQAYFAKSPGVQVEEFFACSFFWGDNAENIYDQLREIIHKG